LILTIAVTISVVVHAALLLVHFVAPKLAETQAADPGLEVILVNSKHDRKPLKADALAQADLDGGGAHDSGRSKSPLPDMNRSEDGDNIRTATKRIEELEQQQRQLLDQAKRKENFRLPQQEKRRSMTAVRRIKAATISIPAKHCADGSRDFTDDRRSEQASAKLHHAEYTKVGYAMYYKELQKRIEDFGTLNFPQKEGKKLYGELIVYIPIFQDGTIYEKEGGPRIEKSSGNKALDKAALRIVRSAAPRKFPQNMRSDDKDDLWVVITRFKFTRDQQLETELRGGKK
jgi:protein TonB